MRTGFTVSTIAHAGLIAIAIIGIGMGRPMDAVPVESIAVDLVPISEFANIRMGSMDSTVVETEAPSVVDDVKPAELAQPTGNTQEDQPTPEDNPDPTPAPTEQTAPAPEASTEPVVEPEPEVAPTPAERPAVEPQPEPVVEPVAEPTPEPTPVATPDVTPDPTDAAPKPTVHTASLDQKRAEFKKQQEAQKQQKADEKAKAEADKKKAEEEKKKKAAEEKERVEQAKADDAKKVADEVANLINNEESRGATTGAGGEATLGREDGRAATLSNSEIGALVAQIQACITLPAGAEDVDARAEFTFSIGADGMVAGQPQMMSSPANTIEDAYARAVQRALMRCGPFTMAMGQDVRAQFAARSF
jgi:colicin import membrane protein